MVTVNEYIDEQFKHLFKYFGFKLKDRINCYNFIRKEFFYNNIMYDILYKKSEIINNKVKLASKKNIILYNEINSLKKTKKRKKLKLKNRMVYYHFNFNKEINSEKKFYIVKYSDILSKLSDKINYYDYNIISDVLNSKNKIISKPILDFKENIILENAMNIFYNIEDKREIELKNQEYNYFNEIKNSNLYAAEYPTFQ